MAQGLSWKVYKLEGIENLLHRQPLVVMLQPN